MLSPSPENAITMRGRSVLVVEDESRLREMLLRAVANMEFASAAAGSAEAALTLLDKQPFDIVLTDLNLPGMPGMDLCERIRQRWPDVQLVILTGYGSLDAAKAAIRLEVADFLTKPTSLGDLEAALNRALRRRLSHITTRPVPAMDLDEPMTDGGASPAGDPPRTLQDLEREHVLAALARHDGNREETAEELGISIRTLYYRLKEYSRLGYMTGSART
jgi:DNA-binding NtrC family response regulator